MDKKRLFSIVAGLLSIAVALGSAASMVGAVRWVEAVTLFAGGFGAGAATRALLESRRRRGP
jgi:CHASE2 domain-containing sensor protein